MCTYRHQPGIDIRPKMLHCYCNMISNHESVWPSVNGKYDTEQSRKARIARDVRSGKKTLRGIAAGPLERRDVTKPPVVLLISERHIQEHV